MQQETIRQLPISHIVSNPQLRKAFDDAALAELAETVKMGGIRQPIRVYRKDDGQFAIITGERRWRAAMSAGLTTVPATVVDGEISESEILESQLIENVQRVDLNPLELARGVDALMKTNGCTAADAAKRVGKSSATISKVLSLLTLPPDVQDRVAAGDIGLRAGHEMARRATAPETSSSSKPQRKQKLTAILDPERTVSTTGVDSTMAAFRGAIETLLARLKTAEKQSVELPAFLQVLRDQAGL